MIKRMDEEAKASFEEMYLTYQDTLRRLAYAYDIPVDDIDDIIQDTFVSYARYDYSLKQPEEGKKILLAWQDPQKPLYGFSQTEKETIL